MKIEPYTLDPLATTSAIRWADRCEAMAADDNAEYCRDMANTARACAWNLKLQLLPSTEAHEPRSSAWIEELVK